MDVRFSRIFKEIIGQFGNLKKEGSFIQNLAFVSSSKTIIALGGFLFTPFLSRIYDPSAYGIFAVFEAYIVIVSSLATLSLPTAFLLPDDENEFVYLFQATFLSSCIISILSVPLFYSNLFSDLDKLGFYKYLLFVGIFLVAMNKSMDGWLHRLKRFKQTSIRGVVINYSSKSFNLGYGVITSGKWDGLIITQLATLIGVFLTNLSLLRRELSTVTGAINFKRMFVTVRKYRRYPLYILPSNWIGDLLARVPAIFLVPVFGLQQVGLLAFATALLDIPIRLIGENAIGVVLLQKTVELKQRGVNRNLLDLINKAYLSLAIISIPTFTIVMIFGSSIFALIFGSQWEESGNLASILCIFYSIRLINSPTSTIMRILEMEKIVVVLIALRLVITLIAAIAAIKLDSFVSFVWIWSIGYSLITVSISSFLYKRLLILTRNGE